MMPRPPFSMSLSLPAMPFFPHDATRCDSLRLLVQGMNSFVYILEGKAAIGPGKGEKEQVDAHNTVTLTKVLLTHI